MAVWCSQRRLAAGTKVRRNDMEIMIAALVLILVLKFGWGLLVFCIEHWVIAILLFAALIAYFAA